MGYVALLTGLLTQLLNCAERLIRKLVEAKRGRLYSLSAQPPRRSFVEPSSSRTCCSERLFGRGFARCPGTIASPGALSSSGRHEWSGLSVRHDRVPPSLVSQC